MAQVAAKAVAPPPPSKCISEAQFVQAATIVFGVYSLQMLLIPAKMITDHFNATADQMTQFWIRGTSVFSFALLYCWQLMPVAAAAKVALWASAGCGLLYPWNAKFNLMKHNFSIKYPMHYVPEVLMAGLTLVGTYVVYL